MKCKFCSITMKRRDNLNTHERKHKNLSERPLDETMGKVSDMNYNPVAVVAAVKPPEWIGQIEEKLASIHLMPLTPKLCSNM